MCCGEGLVQLSSDFDFTGCIRQGDHIAWPQGTGEPLGLTARLMAQAPTLPKSTLLLGMVTSSTLDQASGFDFLCLNGAGGTRIAARAGRVVPAHVSAVPGLIAKRRLPVDVALIRVRPAVERGYLSLGVMVDFVHEMVQSARLVIAELDERMPLTQGDTLIARHDITHLVLADGAELEMPGHPPTEVERAVARNVAGLVPDRATVQLGIGSLPTAICGALASHRDLGLHSGVLPDAVVELIESGVVTNRFKGLSDGYTETGGLFGTRRLFDFADGNPELRLRRATHTHAAATLAQLGTLRSINSAIEIDLTGQVNAEMARGRYVGAVGGQVDFVRGAHLSNGGRSIIALTSTTPDGRVSKIVPDLAGRPVTTARSDVDLVVTEHGVADIWGLDLKARAKALIAIAHPDFREELSRGIRDGALA
jgi:acyl-CoA hydrolase